MMCYQSGRTNCSIGYYNFIFIFSDSFYVSCTRWHLFVVKNYNYLRFRKINVNFSKVYYISNLVGHSLLC